MSNNETDIRILFEKYAKGIATPEEIKQLFAYIQSAEHDRDLGQLLKDELTRTERPDAEKAQLETSLKEVKERIQWLEGADKPKRVPLLRYISAAAILLVALATALYFYLGESSVNRQSEIVNEIRPGYNQATLTLADGKVVRLDSAQTGIIINDADIHYNDGTSVPAVMLSEAEASHKPVELSLSTPKGGQYQIILSDGTKVWLNAASTLKYPSHFSGATKEVFLEGEGYFEIKEDQTKPFQVQTSKQTIAVLGTSFIVNSYSDEPTEKTVLLEGAVKVTSGKNSKLLNPGQEAAITGDIQISKADTEAALAWKNGMFVFNDEPLESIMRKVARWYNVDVAYADGIDKNERFEGSFSRYDNVSGVLKNLSFTGNIHFNLEGRNITVTK